jgi:hypothetical protein
MSDQNEKLSVMVRVLMHFKKHTARAPLPQIWWICAARVKRDLTERRRLPRRRTR